ncbi:MAG: aminoacyl-tRNA hydrolase [Proteobacteria bacterium]|nr:aminoacyl-tRNA hydrolase [Pseudomonadota bacterium]
MIEITGEISIEEREIEESFIRASGPGGQNVNKVSSAVQLRFDVRHSPSLPGAVRTRAARLAGRRLTKEGVIVITAARFRTQEKNRADALARLVALLREAAKRPAPRVPTRPGRAAKARRTDTKTRRGALKRLRGKGPRED